METNSEKVQITAPNFDHEMCRGIYSNEYEFERIDDVWYALTDNTEDAVNAYIYTLQYKTYYHTHEREYYDPEYFTECEFCGSVYPKDEMQPTADCDYVCEHCLDNNYTWCDRCETYHQDCDEVQTGENTTELWCNDCINAHAYRCAHCSGYISSEMAYVTANDEYICERCYQNYYSTCDSCGELYLGEDLDENYLCPNCREKNEGEIHNYSYKPTPSFHYAKGELHHKKMIGVEIETEHGSKKERSEITDRWGEHEKYVYQKHDGSLDDSGIELVTHPMSKKFIDQFNFEGYFDELKNAGARSFHTDNCGLHIHLSRSFFWVGNRVEVESNIVGTALLFFKENEQEIQKFAQRAGNHYCAYPSDGNNLSKDKRIALNDAYCEKSFTKKQMHLKKCNAYSSRYDCINTNNHDTIEFRIFKGTLCASTFRASVEFCIRVTDYAKYCFRNKIKHTSWEQFKTFKKMSPILKAYIEHKKL